MRRRNVKNAHERLVARADILFFEEQVTKEIWKDVFPNNNPTYVEIGCGKGKFLVSLATQNPDKNYIGIEKYESVIIEAVDKVEVGTLPNLHFICGNADHVLTFFNEKSISTIYLNFSDPWPKNKHTKRRLTYGGFLDKYAMLLIPYGTIEFKTDNRLLFEYSLISFNQNHWNFLDLTFDLHSAKENVVTTEYEDRFSAKGNPIYYVEIAKEVKQ
jgi:tRNA (guanine-N7-)-methyltransferase